MSKTTLKAQPGIIILIFLLCSWTSTNWAAGAPYPANSNLIGPSKTDSAPVVVNGRELFSVIGIRSFPARERAELAADKIEAIAADLSNDPELITTEEGEFWTKIVFKDVSVLSILDADADDLGISNRGVIAEAYTHRIREGIEAYRLDRQPEQLKKKIITAGIRTAVLIIILFAIRWLFRFSDKQMERLLARRLKRLEAKSMRMIQFDQIWNILLAVMKLLKLTLIVALIYFFLHFVLELFPWTRYTAHRLMDLVVDPLKSMATGFISYLPSLFFLVILVLITRYLLRLLGSFFETIHFQNMRLKDFDAEWARPTYRIIRVVVIVFAIVVAYPYIPGSNSEAFKGISLFLGVLLSLGSTSVISNIIAGYTMTYRRAFKVGDRVKIGETIGDVLEARLLVTHINSLKNEKIIMPNSTILNSDVINYSALAADKNLILHTKVGIGYEVPWRQVEAMLIEAASRTEGLMKQPLPFVLQQELTDFAVTYELNVSCKNASRMMPLYTELHQNIQDVFNEYGVQIMTPNYVADTAEAKLVPAGQWYTPPANKPEEES
jgi:small-conductance mechanosensitive channel